MAETATDTRSEIIEAARSEFFAHGYEGARLQKIADHIGVTKAMIHYYFNTKKELFEQVYRQSVDEIFGELDEVLDQDVPLFKKIEQLVEHCLQKSGSLPNVLSFVITESNRQRDWLQPIFDEQINLKLNRFNSELETAASNYEIASVSADNLMLNIFSLCYYPAIATPVNQSLLGASLSKEQTQRKGLVLDTILNWLTA
ncbi:MAG TPA: TetR/AcrR family transcriptional regulator [Balneolaceae bacterium]|nr:TetR/AcrR family transcriptional regulator [Balneolaceae bacterium]